ncbi:uracil-DNA glycosylase family protein [Gracilimonas sp.]|uniref:uracil-DNA glycosylase n=1 Tax=Gracilimonas sp. TaxID=1974203 RepID=UPI00287209E1|nr:uracil-DNA glycosylase [Gracilimonas sp.]
MNNPKDLIEKAEKFLQQQSEIYGEFSVDFKKQADQGSDKVIDTSSSDNENQKVKEPLSKYSTGSETDLVENTPKLSMSEKIAACSSLDELRALCEEAEELKTDLEGTNLVFGVGNPNADLMIVGEAPGFNEDKQGEPFVGKAGRLLDQIMDAIDFQRDEIYIANILKHRPPNNRDPKPEERERSLPFLLRQIELIDPKIILCVGRVSATTLLNKETSLSKIRQKSHSFHGRELMATYHPAALLRNPKWKRPTWEDVQKLRKRYDELGGK